MTNRFVPSARRPRRLPCSLCLSAAAAAGVLAALHAPSARAVTSSATSSATTDSAVTTASKSPSAIVTLAQAYIDTLTSAQKTASVVSNTAANAAKWSNLPATPGSDGTNSRRNGVAYSSLTKTQKTAWINLVSAALGTNGYYQFNLIQASDDYLGTLSSGYNGLYEYVGFVGTPTTSGGWMLQVGGHHNAQNFFYNGTKLLTTTPYHLGVEPTSFSNTKGTAFEPLEVQRAGMYNLINSLTSTQLKSAKLSSSYSDIYLGPGKDARSYFPTSNRGLQASDLTTAQKRLVLKAMQAWLDKSPNGVNYYSLYEGEIDSTYVAYSGTTGFTKQGDYVRIDGPHVWIEFCCQNGVVIQNKIHYHTVWRDRVLDYNAYYGF